MASDPPPSPNNSTETNSTSMDTFNFQKAPKLGINLDERNFLLWNKQVESIVKMYKLQRFLVSPIVPPQFNTDADRVAGTVFAAYEQWLVQNQTNFSWLLTTLSNSVLPRVLTCDHSFQLWERIQDHYFAHLKAKARQIKSELTSSKKGSKSITEFISHLQSLADSLTAVGVTVTDSDLCDSILDGLPEDYSNFVMMMYGRSEPLHLSELESLLLVQEAQLEKYKQELAVAGAQANIAQTTGKRNQNHNPNIRYSYSYARNGRNRGYRGRGGRGRSRGGGRNQISSSSSDSRPVVSCVRRQVTLLLTAGIDLMKVLLRRRCLMLLLASVITKARTPRVMVMTQRL